MAKQFQKVRGMYDILPERWRLFAHVMNTFTQVAEDAGFGRIVTPVLEDEALFVRTIGEGTDVMDKEIYSFEDRGGHRVALRPEGTAGVVRAYIENGLASRPRPVKLYYIADMFRYDRPQEGRYRQHQQVGAEVFGDPNPSADVQLIMVLFRLYKRLGLKNVSLQVNSIGDAACRAKYHKDLVDYLQQNTKNLPEIDRNRLQKNPLRVLDSKEAATQKILDDAPQILNYLCEDCQKHFAGVLEYLDDLGVSYEINHRLVRGLDYYTRTVFELYGGREGAQSALGGGGRYDALLEQLGGQPTPAVGFASGIERVILELEAAGDLPPEPRGADVYVASLGESARLEAFRLIEELLDSGIATSGVVDRDSIGSQLARADKLGVRYAVIIGQKEVKEGTVLLRDMASGAQETIKATSIVKELSGRVKK
jgi:histidyl-tRNA synthetase